MTITELSAMNTLKVCRRRISLKQLRRDIQTVNRQIAALEKTKRVSQERMRLEVNI